MPLTITRDVSALVALQAHERGCEICGCDGYSACATGLPLARAAADIGVPWLTRYRTPVDSKDRSSR